MGNIVQRSGFRVVPQETSYSSLVGVARKNLHQGRRMVPLAPYFFFRSIHSAFVGSVVVTLLALLVFGYIKGRFTTARPFRSAWQTVIVGGLAATAAFVIAKAIG